MQVSRSRLKKKKKQAKITKMRSKSRAGRDPSLAEEKRCLHRESTDTHLMHNCDESHSQRRVVRENITVFGGDALYN